MSSDDDHTSRDPRSSRPPDLDAVVNRRLNELIEGLPEPSLLYDDNGRITFANAEFRRLSNRSLAELIGKRPFEWDDGTYADQPDRETYRAQLANTLTTGEDCDYTRTRRRPDGGVDVYRLSFRALHDDTGRITGASAFARNESDLTDARRDASAREHEFRWLLDNLPDVVIRYDLDCRAIYVNHRMGSDPTKAPTKVLGLTPAETEHEHVAGMVELERRMRGVLATGAPDQVEISFDNATGHHVHSFLIRAERDQAGTIVGAFVIGRDITELVRARLEVAAREQEFRSLAANLPDVVMRYDREGRLVYVNDAFERQLGWERPRLGDRPTSGGHSSSGQAAEYEGRLLRVIESGRPEQMEVAVVDAAGQPGIHSVVIRAEVAPDGEIVGALAIGHDVTDLVRARGEIAARESQFRSLAENLPEIVIRYDREGRAMYINHRVPNQEGLDERHIVGKRPTEGAPAGLVGVDELERCLDRTLATGEPTETELTVPDLSGDVRVHSVLIRAELAPDGEIVGALAIGRDVTELVRASERATEGERRFRSLAENATDFIGRWSPDGRRLYVNPTLARLMGGAPEELVGQLSRGGDGQFSDVVSAIQRCVREAAPTTVLHQHTDPGDGVAHVHEVRLVPELDESGSIVSVLGIGRDITEVMRQRAELERAATTDALTGVASRQVLYSALQPALDANAENGRSVAVLLADLDGFKDVNDQYGHRFGDQILRSVARELAAALDPGGIIVRLGGDEFVLVAEIDCPTDAAILAQRAQLRLGNLRDDQHQFPPLDMSVGVAIAPHDGDGVDTLLAAADLALYAAKSAGRSSIEFYHPDLRTALERRMTIERALRECVPDAEMELHLQPICSLDGATSVWGAEALLRWTHPELGVVTPDEFIPIAEQSGQIVPIGRWVSRRAAEIAVALNSHRSRPLRVAVNVSTRQFTLDDIAATVREATAACGCNPGWLVLELTESLLLEDLPLVHRSLNQLRALGVAVAIDDFGTGYSALHYLNKLHIDHLKIDKSFVRDADVDPQQQEIVRALVAMAHALGIGTVAEGIESTGQLDLLRELGCGLGQGYLLARPMPADRFGEWLETAEATPDVSLPVN